MFSQQIDLICTHVIDQFKIVRSILEYVILVPARGMTMNVIWVTTLKYRLIIV